MGSVIRLAQAVSCALVCSWVLLTRPLQGVSKRTRVASWEDLTEDWEKEEQERFELLCKTLVSAWGSGRHLLPAGCSVVT